MSIPHAYKIKTGESAGSKSGLLFMQRDIMPTKRKYTQACPMEQGRRSGAFALSSIWSVTCLEAEDVITLLISVKVLND
jgi:hypothetical protein